MSPRSHEPSNERRLGRAIALPTIFALAAGALTGCAVANAEPSPKPTHSHSAEATPTPTPSESDTIPESLVKYEALTPEQFNALPKSEQRAYAGWLGRDLQSFANEFARVSKDPRDVLVPASINNTPDQIIAIATNNNRYAFSLSGSDRQKWVIALDEQGENSPLYPEFSKEISQQQDGLTAGVIAYDKVLQMGTVTKNGQVTTGSNGEAKINMTFTQPGSDAPITEDFYLVTLNNQGSSYSTWVTN